MHNYAFKKDDHIMKFVLPLLHQLPLYTDFNFESFVRNWLSSSGVDIDRLHKKSYNRSVQSMLGKTCVGENYDDEKGLALFVEFKYSVCLYLEFVR